jgi:hypothetical protein
MPLALAVAKLTDSADRQYKTDSADRQYKTDTADRQYKTFAPTFAILITSVINRYDCNLYRVSKLLKLIQHPQFIL